MKRDLLNVLLITAVGTIAIVAFIAGLGAYDKWKKKRPSRKMEKGGEPKFPKGGEDI